MRIVFMGTPEFAVPSLQILHENNYSIVGVVTAPDKPQGRGKLLGESAVKKYATDQKLKILQPIRLKDSIFLRELEDLNADLFIVVAFRMLPEVVWKMPTLGTFNLHASLLPNYRGAAPINWAIINGEKETGVTTFFLRHEIDTGEILLQEREIIHRTDDVGSLYSRLMAKGAGLVLKTVQLIQSGEHKTIPQPEITAIHAPKIFREDCKINWEQHSEDVYNFIRGLSPYPGSWCVLAGKQYKVFQASVSQNRTLKPGEWSINAQELLIGTLDFAMNITVIQAEGKKRMRTTDYLKGNEIGK